MRRKALLLTAGAALVAAVAVGVLLSRGSGDGPPAASAPAQARTVVVAETGVELPDSPFVALRDCLGRPRSCVNGTAGLVLAYGAISARPAGPPPPTVLPHT